MDQLTNCLTDKDVDQSWLDEKLDRKRAAMCLVSFDCDTFKNLVEVFGFHDSDNRLIEIVQKIKARFATVDVFRCGGDEFAVLIECNGETEETLQDFLQSISKTYEYNTRQEKEQTFLSKLWWKIMGAKHVAPETHNYESSVSCYVTPLPDLLPIEKLWELHDNATDALTKLNAEFNDGRRRGVVLTAR